MSDSIGTHDVTVTRTMPAPPERVWQAWTTPEGWASWFGAGPYRTPSEQVSLDVRPGGAWAATQVSAEDGSSLPFGGHFLEVVERVRLVLTFENPEDPADQSRETATVTLEDLGDGTTRMTLHQGESLPSEQYPLLAQGYNLFFDRMEAALGGS